MKQQVLFVLILLSFFALGIGLQPSSNQVIGQDAPPKVVSQELLKTFRINWLGNDTETARTDKMVNDWIATERPTIIRTEAVPNGYNNSNAVLFIFYKK